MHAARPNPTLIVGVDGLGPQAVVRLTQSGRLPVIQSVLNQGQRYRLTATIPDEPAVLWADLATGQNATDHGVLAAVKPTAQGLGPVTTDDWRIEPLWLRVARLGMHAAAINWPASTPGDVPSSELQYTVSDLEINAEPGVISNGGLSSDSRLNATDIAPQMASALAGEHAALIDSWSVDEPRRLALSAALARAGTIQNAAVDAIERQGDRPGLVMVRYDLPAVLAQIVLPRPGVFDRGGDVPDEVRMAVIDGGAQLIDTMIGELLRRMPTQTAVMVVGLLDYAIDTPARDYTDRPDPDDPMRVIVDKTRDAVFWGDTRPLHSCRRTGGFAAWHDPASPLPPDPVASNQPIKKLYRLVRTRLRLPPQHEPDTLHAQQLVGLNDQAIIFEDRLTLGIGQRDPTIEDAWRNVVDRRAINLARAASAHHRWHFAAHAWDLAIARSDRFVYHVMRLEALLNSKQLTRFDRELMAWLERVPDQPMLRTLAQARATINDPPPPKPPPPDHPSPYTRLPDRAKVPTEQYMLWNELSPAELSRLHQACEPAARGCRLAYLRFAEAWAGYSQTRPHHADDTASDMSPGRDGLIDALARSGHALAGVNSFSDRHGSLNERARTIGQSIDQLDTQTDLEYYTPAWLQQLHRSLFVSADAAPHAGVFRQDNLETGVRMPRIDGTMITNDPLLDPSYNLPELADRMLAALRRQVANPSLDPLVTATLCFMSLLKAHPFIDGNGRTSRTLLMHILQHHGMPLIRHTDLPTWFERKREPYLGQCMMLSHARLNQPDQDHDNLTIVLTWLIDLIRDATNHATQCLARLSNAKHHTSAANPPS